MDVNKLIPKDKGDIEVAEKLSKYSYEELKTIVPKLLTWIQDMNWPVAGPVSTYLESISEYLTNDIVTILKGKDEVWKYWCIKVFGIDTDKDIDPILMQEIIRIATNPTQGEIDDEVQELALEFMANTYSSNKG